jgi:ribosome biogenesis protein MAK21
MFASRLLNDEKMPPKPDLTSHTLSHFLDKFVYRNAKASAGGPKGSSIMQPLSGGDSKGILLSSRTVQGAQQPVNTEAFWQKKAEDVAVDEVFFHKYFNQMGKGKQASDKKKEKAAKTADGSDNEEDENEDEIWQALVDSRPEVEGLSDDDSDLEMLDLEDSDQSDAASALDDAEVAGEDDEEAAADSDSDDGVVLSGFGGDEDIGSEDEVGSELDELFAKELEMAQPEAKGEETSRQKRRKLKSLPTFASVEDYAEMLDNDEDEDF